MDNMDGFSFIFNNEGLFNFKDNDMKEETATNEPEKNEELEMLKKHIHVKNQIILGLLKQCDAYSEVVTSIIETASTIPDIDIKTNGKINDVSKALNEHKKLNEMLKMAIEFEEMMESNENHTI